MEFNNYFILGCSAIGSDVCSSDLRCRPCGYRRYWTWYRPGYRSRTCGSSGWKKPGRKIRHYFHHAFRAGRGGDHRSLWSVSCHAVNVC